MPGHVFLVHGDLTKLSCDAWLVPSSDTPRRPGSLWRHAVKDTPPPGTPTSWRQVRGRVLPWEPLQPNHPCPWLVLTINWDDSSVEDFVEPGRQFLKVAYDALPEEGTSGRKKARNGRALPLLALPVVGAGRGGGAA
jgi:hypothetical protein